MADIDAIFQRMMTPEQCRAARALLNWTQQQLADAAGVGTVTIRQFENGRTTPQRWNLHALERALETAGVEFTDGSGVKFRQPVAA